MGELFTGDADIELHSQALDEWVGQAYGTDALFIVGDFEVKTDDTRLAALGAAVGGQPHLRRSPNKGSPGIVASVVTTRRSW